MSKSQFVDFKAVKAAVTMHISQVRSLNGAIEALPVIVLLVQRHAELAPVGCDQLGLRVQHGGSLAGNLDAASGLAGCQRVHFRFGRC